LDVLFAVTRSEKGSVIVHGNVTVEQAATKVEEIVDTTGAGDAYAAGFLYGWTNDRTLSECAKYGTYCATKVIQQLGARIEKGLLDNFS
jgi:sugar/nucleoside kinase (ribokinase family)